MAKKNREESRILLALKLGLHSDLDDLEPAKILGAFVRQLGGPEEMGRHAAQVFLDGQPMAKQRILDSMLRMAKYVADKNPGMGDLGLVSEDDLEKYALLLGRQLDGQAQAGAENKPG